MGPGLFDQEVQFFAAGEPVPKGRPRFSIRGGKVWTYTPDRTQRWEETIKAHALHEFVRCPWRKDLKGKFGLHVVVATSRKGTRRGDLDNHVKAVCDSLNGILFDDDSTVMQLVAEFQFVSEAEEGVWVRLWKKAE